MSRVDQPPDFYLEAIERGVDITDCSTRAAFLPKYVPRFECLPYLEIDTALSNSAISWKAKFEVRGKPIFLQPVPVTLKISDDLMEVVSHKMREHESVMEFCAPANQLLLIRRFPKACDQRA